MATYPTHEEQQLRNMDKIIAALETTHRIFEQDTLRMNQLQAQIDALTRGMDALTEHVDAVVTATSAELRAARADFVYRDELDNLRAEMLGRIAEATATPFDPPPTQEGHTP